MSTHKPMISSGPFRTHQLRESDRYELSDGHAIYCAPSGGTHARAAVVGSAVLASDPLVESAGLDAGFTTDDMNLRAPDIAVGNVPDKPGWIKGVPPLAVEYASVGQDEAELQVKIEQLLTAGTRFVWVVRMVGPRRVEVYTKDSPTQTLGPTEQLEAPGILQNAVPVEAMYEPSVARDATLRNLLQREGYTDLASVRAEGRAEGREEGQLRGARQALRAAITARGWTTPPAVDTRISQTTNATTLQSWLVQVIQAARLDAVFTDSDEMSGA